MIDLHLHTSFSYGDGYHSPAEVVGIAKRNGVRAIAITDHDTTEGISEAIAEGKRLGVEVIPSIEISSRYKGKSLHILGHFINACDEGLQSHINRMAKLRYEENLLWMGALIGADIPFPDEDMTMFMRKGINTLSYIISQASKYSGKSADELRKITGKILYLNSRMSSTTEIIRLIQNAGGIAVLAHPGRYKYSFDELVQITRDLALEGLAGVEVYYSQYSPEITAFCKKLADDNHLAYSGGTDFHGYAKNDGINIGFGLGNLHVPESVLDGLKLMREMSRST